MKNNKVFLVLVFFVFLSMATLLKLRVSYAASPTDITGWMWGGSEDSLLSGVKGSRDGNDLGLGFISLNSKNCDSDLNNFVDVSCGGNNTTTAVVANYVVNVPSDSGSKVTGFAWSGNLGWIDFNPQDHCTTGVPNVALQQYTALSCTPPSGSAGIFTADSNSLVGWARFVSIARATAGVNNAGGFTGWIRIYSSSDPAPKNTYTVSSDADGNLTGFAFSELGAIQIKGKRTMPPQVTLDLVSPSSPVLLSETETLASKAPKVTLHWAIPVGGTMSSCTKSCKDSADNVISCPDWENAVLPSMNQGDSGNVSNIALPANSVKFEFKCTGLTGLESNVASRKVEAGCTNKSCSSQVCKIDLSKLVLTDNGSDCPSSADICSTDSDCIERSTGGWTEVSP
jgi:hypothetical protein